MPKQQKRMMLNLAQKGKAAGSRTSVVRRSSLSSVGAPRGSQAAAGGERRQLQQSFFVPLAIIAESIHVKIHHYLLHDWGKDFATDLCSPCRFSNFLHCIIQLAKQTKAVREQQVETADAVVDACEQLQDFQIEVETKLRSIRTNLCLVVEEARRLTQRVARESELRSLAKEAMGEVVDRQEGGGTDCHS